MNYRANILLLGIVGIFVAIEILFLRPSRLESDEQEPKGMFSSIEEMVLSKKEKDEVGYTIEGFHYTSTENEKKMWELNSNQALLYQVSRLFVADKAKIKMFDQAGQITFIEGNKAFYKMGNREIDLEGAVKVTFPDGFVLTTDKAHYSAATDEITSATPFYGESAQKPDEVLMIWGTGFRASKKSPIIDVLSQAKVRVRKLKEQEITEVHSDLAKIDRNKKTAVFWMADKTKFVESDQGSLHVKSRRQEALYDSTSKEVQYLQAFNDVLIREMDPKKSQNGLKYATCERADFLAKEDKVLLSGFPSAYQETDTVTGDLITIYRKQNLIEVTEANAFHQGQ